MDLCGSRLSGLVRRLEAKKSCVPGHANSSRSTETPSGSEAADTPPGSEATTPPGSDSPGEASEGEASPRTPEITCSDALRRDPLFRRALLEVSKTQFGLAKSAVDEFERASASAEAEDNISSLRKVVAKVRSAVEAEKKTELEFLEEKLG